MEVSGKILEELVDIGNRICYYELHGVKFLKLLCLQPVCPVHLVVIMVCEGEGVPNR